VTVILSVYGHQEDENMRVPVLMAVVTLAVSGGCATVRQVLVSPPRTIDRLASNPPDMFVQEDGRAKSGNACLTTIVDPRDNTSLQLVRKVSGQGDYRAPAGKYGVSDTELLRVDCTTTIAVGIVRTE